MSILLACAFLATSPQRIRIVNGPAGASLMLGTVKFALYNQAWSAFGGGKVFNSMVQGENSLVWVSPRGSQEKIDLTALQADWLKDESKWGSHEAANQIRYMAGPGGGLSFQLEELVPTSASEALALLDIHLVGTPVEPVAYQMLVRLSLGPFRLKFVRSIPNHADNLFGADKPRLFQVGAHLYAADGDHMQEINAAGDPVRTCGTWDRDEVPYGLAGGRWIVGSLEKNGFDEIVVTDPVLQRSFLLSKTKSDPHGSSSTLGLDSGSISGKSDFVLLHWNDAASGKLYALTIHLPDGRRRAAPGEATDVIGPYLIAQAFPKVEVYSIATGKRIFASRYSNG